VGLGLWLAKNFLPKKNTPRPFLENTIYKQIDGDVIIRSSNKEQNLGESETR
jgi:hypothetical protein